MIEQGYLGDLVDITVNMDHFRPNDASQGGNFDGAWYGHGVHLVDQMVSLLELPKKFNTTFARPEIMTVLMITFLSISCIQT